MGVYYIGSIPCSGGDIYHFGRKGMKWGQTIFGDLADRLAKRGWGGASRVARGISTGFGRANEFINADQARAQLNAAKANRRGYNTQNRLAAKYDYVDDHTGSLDYNVEGRNMGKNPKGYGPTISANERVQNAQAAYDKTLPGMMAKAREKVSTAYADAAAAIGKKGLDIQSFYSQVMQKAQGAINQGKNMVSKYGGQFVSQIQTLGSNALAGGKAFLEGIMKKAKQVKSKATEPISRKKGQEGEKRARESEIGKQNTHDMLRRRRNNTQQYYKTENKFERDYGWTSLSDTNRNSLAEERYNRKLYRPKKK